MRVGWDGKIGGRSEGKRVNKFSVPDEIRKMASEAAKCMDPLTRKLLRKSVTQVVGHATDPQQKKKNATSVQHVIRTMRLTQK